MQNASEQVRSLAQWFNAQSDLVREKGDMSAAYFTAADKCHALANRLDEQSSPDSGPNAGAKR